MSCPHGGAAPGFGPVHSPGRMPLPPEPQRPSLALMSPTKTSVPGLYFTRDLGWTHVRNARSHGRLVKIRRGVSALPLPQHSSPWEAERRQAFMMMAAVADALHVNFVFGFASAALLHGLGAVPWDGRAHVIQRHRQGRWRAAGLHHHWGFWDEDEVTVINGYPVTSITRTVLDCAVYLPPDWALGVADAGLRRLADMSRFHRVESSAREQIVRAGLMERLGDRKRAKGIVKARNVLACADGFAESLPESRMRCIALAGGLPPPTCQMPIKTVDGLRYPDLAWPMATLTGDLDDPRILAEEYDGVEKYAPEDAASPAAVLNRQARRDESLRLANVHVRHRGARDIESPSVLFESMVRRFPPCVVSSLQPRPSLLPLDPTLRAG